jgi:hypothetical protein
MHAVRGGRVTGCKWSVIEPLGRLEATMKPLRATCLVVAAAMSILVAPTSAVAAPPSNDDLQNAIRITTPFPFRDSVDITDATRDTGAPSGCADGRSVWYRFSLARTQRILLTTLNSNYDTVLNLFRRTDTGGLRRVACNDDGGVGLTSALVHRVEGGARYVVMVADLNDGTTPATLRFQMNRAIEAQVRLSGRGQIDRIGGGARVFGTVRCSHPGSLSVFVELRQRVGDAAAAHGFGSRGGIECGRQETTWRLRIDPEGSVAFVPGRARVVDTRWSVCEPFGGGCTFGRFGRTTVRLVR